MLCSCNEHLLTACTCAHNLQGNALTPHAHRINLYGVAIGNGVTDSYYDAKGQYLEIIQRYQLLGWILNGARKSAVIVLTACPNADEATLFVMSPVYLQLISRSMKTCVLLMKLERLC